MVMDLKSKHGEIARTLMPAKNEGTRGDQAKHLRLIIILSLFAAFNALFGTKILDNISSVNSNIADGPTLMASRTIINDNGNSNEKSICSNVWGYFYDESDEKFGRAYLEELYKRSDKYHNLGGNYKALSNFMNGAVDATYDTVGLTPFVPNDNGKNSKVVGTNVQQFIREELRKDDTGNRGGYYQRKLPGKFQQSNVTGKQYKQLITSGRALTSVIEPVTVKRWDIAMGPKLEEESCKGFHVLKQHGGQAKYICGWDQLMASNTAKNKLVEGQKKQRSCNVISIGSNDQWAFEMEMIGDTDCTIHTFDCTIQTPKKKPKSDQVKFYPVCITGDPSLRNNNGRFFATYFDLIEKVGLSQEESITYLKIDVGGYEWEVFLNMIEEARDRNMHHLLPEQIQVELHYASWMFDLPWFMRTVQTGELMSVFSALFREAGYMAVFNERTRNPKLKEVLLIKIYC